MILTGQTQTFVNFYSRLKALLIFERFLFKMVTFQKIEQIRSVSRVKTLYSHVLDKWNVDCYIGENKEVKKYQIDTCLLCSQVHRYTCNFGSFLDVYRFHYYDKVQRHMDLHLKVHKQEAHRKHCSHEKHFLTKNKLKQSHDYKNMLVKTLFLVSFRKRALPFIWTTLNHLCPNMFCAKLVEIPKWFWQRRFLNDAFSVFRYYLPLETLHFRKVSVLVTVYTINQRECELEKKISKELSYIFYHWVTVWIIYRLHSGASWSSWFKDKTLQIFKVICNVSREEEFLTQFNLYL